MKRIAFVLTLLALAFSPLMVSQADAAPVKHHAAAKHHRKMIKKHAKRLVARKHHRKASA